MIDLACRRHAGDTTRVAPPELICKKLRTDLRISFRFIGDLGKRSVAASRMARQAL